MSTDLSWAISIDDHIIEPADLWQDRVASKYKDRAPKLVRNDEGEFWQYEDKFQSTWGLTAAAGKDKEDHSPFPIRYDEMRESCYDPKARLVDMDRDRVLAQGTFGSFVKTSGATFYDFEDKDLALACLRAYNDYIIDEWCMTAPGRFIPFGIIPMWDPKMAGEEAERVFKKGAKAISFTENPAQVFRDPKKKKGPLPSIHDASGYWERLFSVCNETGMPLALHVGASQNPTTTAPDAPMAVTATCIRLLHPQKTALDYLFSGWFKRLPNLKIVLSEGGIGWIPSLLDLADHHVKAARGWAKQHGDFDVTQQFAAKQRVRAEGVDGGFKPFTIQEQMDPEILPSALFKKHIYGCFLQDEYGAQILDHIGVDDVMLESDFPHGDSTWPNTVPRAHRVLGHRSDEDKLKIFRTNAMRVFDFVPAEAPSTTLAA